MTGRTTGVWLALGIAVAGAVDVWVHRPPPPAAPLPRTPAVSAASVTGVRLQEGDTIVEFARQGAGEDALWQVIAPYRARADQDGVQGIVDRFTPGVAMDVRVDALTDDNDDTYGLDNANLLRVDLLGADGPLSTLYVGADGPGGASFVRPVDDDTVYRARLGGRHRYDRAPAEWRDRRLLHVEPGDVTAVELPNARLDRTGEGWRTEVGRADPDAVEQLVAALARLRVDVLVERAPSAPATAVVTLFTSGGPRTLSLWRDEQGVIAQSDGSDAGRVDARLLDVVGRSAAEWADRRVFPFAAAQVDAVAVYDRSRLVSAFARGSDGAWTRTVPKDVAVDARAVDQALARLAQWRPTDPAPTVTWPAVVGFVPPEMRIELSVGADVHEVRLLAGGVAVDEGPRLALPEAEAKRVITGLR